MTLRVGLIGTSWWADAMYLPALAHHPRGAITALCGRDPDRTRASAARWGVPQVHTEWLEMVDSGSIDAVIVASPNDTHHDVVMAAADRGLHVLCEKPVALSADEAAAMAAAAEAAGIVTMVPFTYRWMPTNRWMKALVEEGYVGQPYHLNLRYFTGYARGPEYSWRFDVARSGGGLLGDLGSHWLHLARWWLGEVSSIGAISQTFVERDLRPDGSDYVHGEDSAVMTLRFASGAYGTLQVSAVCWEGTPFGQTHHAEVHGSEGTLYARNDWDTVQEVRGLRSGDHGGPQVLPVPDELWQGARRSSVHDTYRDVFRAGDSMTRAWVDAAADGRPCQPDLAEGARVQALVEAATASAASDGRQIAVDP
ncbi:MAG TPA: Gfo/Idh/MocA family oxidoreductase [Acidimicrobiales bacterium]|nr:Gfo/Idh/MocA family oxidoreductase [Acidimicrobiales bacterium]